MVFSSLISVITASVLVHRSEVACSNNSFIIAKNVTLTLVNVFIISTD